MWHKKGGKTIIKCFIKTTKGSKKVEDKNRNKLQGLQIENSNQYGNINPTISVITLNV